MHRDIAIRNHLVCNTCDCTGRRAACRSFSRTAFPNSGTILFRSRPWQIERWFDWGNENSPNTPMLSMVMCQILIWLKDTVWITHQRHTTQIGFDPWSTPGFPGGYWRIPTPPISIEISISKYAPVQYKSLSIKLFSIMVVQPMCKNKPVPTLFSDWPSGFKLNAKSATTLSQGSKSVWTYSLGTMTDLWTHCELLLAFPSYR